MRCRTRTASCAAVSEAGSGAAVDLPFANSMDARRSCRAAERRHVLLATCRRWQSDRQHSQQSAARSRTCLVYAWCMLGVSVCGFDLNADERRVGKEWGYDDIQFQLRGGFGGARDKAEDLMPDTRWVKLDDLVEAMPKRDLKKLFTFSKNLVSVLEAAEQELREGEGEEAE